MLFLQGPPWAQHTLFFDSSYDGHKPPEGFVLPYHPQLSEGSPCHHSPWTLAVITSSTDTSAFLCRTFRLSCHMWHCNVFGMPWSPFGVKSYFSEGESSLHALRVQALRPLCIGWLRNSSVPVKWMDQFLWLTCWQAACVLATGGAFSPLKLDKEF